MTAHSKAPTVKPIVQPAIAEADRLMEAAGHRFGLAILACRRGALDTDAQIQGALRAIAEARAALARAQEGDD